MTKPDYKTVASRREALQLLGCGTLAAFMMPSLLAFRTDSIMKRKIPGTTELLPVVGLGTWQTFDVGSDAEMRKQLTDVLLEMKRLGGAMIDSSPMYGRSEGVVGELTEKAGIKEAFFYATKVWIEGEEAGIRQMNESMFRMGKIPIDLMQIHNLVDWKTHVKTLRAWKSEEKIRYWGFTHYTERSHKTLETLVRQQNPDFVQFNYSMAERNAEKRLLDTCRDMGVGVIINRPYGGGSLFKTVKGKELPEWCAELDINSWGQYFLKYILSHEAVNVVIPGTSKVKHVIDNMGAGYGRIPDQSERKKMLDYFIKL
ncbi:MAG: aldo/keto reductase [Flavobacteriaceae bacterium]|nr:aldo/keto reductase [Flavobacteriaceae bacterium]